VCERPLSTSWSPRKTVKELVLGTWPVVAFMELRRTEAAKRGTGDLIEFHGKPALMFMCFVPSCALSIFRQVIGPWQRAFRGMSGTKICAPLFLSNLATIVLPPGYLTWPRRPQGSWTQQRRQLRKCIRPLASGLRLQPGHDEIRAYRSQIMVRARSTVAVSRHNARCWWEAPGYLPRSLVAAAANDAGAKRSPGGWTLGCLMAGASCW
jgi:hypothetical protein